MAEQCKECGSRLGFFEKMRGECNDCFRKRRMEMYAAAAAADARRWEEQKKKWPWRIFNRTTASTSLAHVTEATSLAEATKQSRTDESWVEVLLTLAWFLCFSVATVFAFMALVAANDRYEEGAAIIFTAYAVSLCVSGVVFAAIGKIVSFLRAINENLSLLVEQKQKAGGTGLKET